MNINRVKNIIVFDACGIPESAEMRRPNTKEGADKNDGTFFTTLFIHYPLSCLR